MFENVFTGIRDKNGTAICNGMKVLIIDKNKIGVVKYSLKRCAFRIFLCEKKNTEDKNYSIASGHMVVNQNLLIV